MSTLSSNCGGGDSSWVSQTVEDEHTDSARDTKESAYLSSPSNVDKAAFEAVVEGVEGVCDERRSHAT
jgi:hypothetical protein